MSGITEHDMESVREAVAVLEDAGFTVDGLDDVERVNHGIRFSVSAVANTRTKSFDDSD